MPVFEDTPVLCGHRGSGRGVVGGHAENTLGSFRAAADAGLRWVEVDARVTADEELVARHDPVAPDGRFVSELRAAQTDAQGIMRLEELFTGLAAEVAIDVEVKSSLKDALRPPERTTAALVAERLAAEAPRRHLLLSSFDPAALTIAARRAPDIPRGLLTWLRFPLRKAIPAAVHLGAQVVAPHVQSFEIDAKRAHRRGERPAARAIEVAHAAGVQVLAWCPDRAQAKALIAAGVDCLVVDEAPRAARRGPAA